MILIFLFFGGSAAAQAPAPDDPQLKAAYDDLFQQMLERPSDLDVMFKFAAVATRLGNYEAAIGTLERMLLINPDLPRVKLELGVLYFRLESYEVAKGYLNDAVAGGNAPALVQGRVAAYLEEIEGRQSRHRLYGFVSFGVRYQTNANAGPASAGVKAAGFDASLDDEFLEQDDWNVYVNAQARHSYDLKTRPGESWDTTAQVYLARYFELEELDLNYLEATTGPEFVLDRGTDGNLTGRPFVLANVVTLDDEMHFYTLGGGFEFHKPVGDRVVLDGDYQLRYRDYVNSTERPTNDEDTGIEHAVSIAARYFVTDDVALGAGFSVADEDTRKDSSSNTEVAAFVSASLLYDAPFGLTELPWQVTLTGQGIFTDYDEPDPSVDPTVTREDDEWRIALGNTIPLTREWHIGLQVQHTVNESNLPNFEYDNTSFLFSLSRFF